MIGKASARSNSGKSGWRWLAEAAIGGVVGAAAGYLAVHFGPEIELDGAHPPGFAIGVMLAFVGLIVLAASFGPKSTAKMLALDADEGDVLREERTSLLWQGIVASLAGAELIILSLRTDTLTGPAAPILLMLLAAILVVQTWLNWRLWRVGDELFRRLIVQATVIGFLAFQFLLFFWTVGARFGLIADPDALDIYVLMMALYLAGSGVAAYRHGYGRPV